MKKLLMRFYLFITSKLSWRLPSWFLFWFEYIKTEIRSILIYKKLKNFLPDIKLLDNNKKNIICFSEHPYTNKILRNGINIKNDKLNLITFWKVFGIYADITQWDRNSSFNMEWWWNYHCYEKLWEYYKKKNGDFFNKSLLGACDFSLPTQVFWYLNKNIIYLNHRFPYLWFFNVFKLSDWQKKINNLKQDNNILIAANNFDYEYHKYFLWESKKIYYIPPLLDEIPDKYKWINDSFLIVPGKDKYFKQREEIIDLCLREIWNKWIDNIFSITRKYKNKRYEFKEIAWYKALIVIPYTIYIWSIMDFLEMWMPMFFPSVKLLARWHKECNLLVEYDFISLHTEVFWKNIFNKKFLDKIEDYIWLGGSIPSPYSDDIEGLEYWISKSDWYANWPIITFDSFEDLANKLKTTDMEKYSRTLLAFNKEQKTKSKKARKFLLDNI